MRPFALPLTLLALVVSPLGAQLSDSALNEVIREAEATPTAENHVAAAQAARLMRDYDAASAHLEDTWDALGPIFNGLVNEHLYLALASGEGVSGLQRAFRQLGQTFAFSPIEISNWAGNYPEILAGGEYDQMVMKFSPESTDPAYRCACLNSVAWAHRLAGRHDEAREAWAVLVQQEPAALTNAVAEGDLDVEATVRGQYARNLARAGRHDEAREHLQRAMALEVSDAQLPLAQRRWAQAFAELGDAAGAVEQLEPLLEANSLITVHTLESRVAWMFVRDDPAFQALLERHR